MYVLRTCCVPGVQVSRLPYVLSSPSCAMHGFHLNLSMEMSLLEQQETPVRRTDEGLDANRGSLIGIEARYIR